MPAHRPAVVHKKSASFQFLAVGHSGETIYLVSMVGIHIQVQNAHGYVVDHKWHRQFFLVSLSSHSETKCAGEFKLHCLNITRIGLLIALTDLLSSSSHYRGNQQDGSVHPSSSEGLAHYTRDMPSASLPGLSRIPSGVAGRPVQHNLCCPVKCEKDSDMDMVTKEPLVCRTMAQSTQVDIQDSRDNENVLCAVPWQCGEPTGLVDPQELWSIINVFSPDTNGEAAITFDDVIEHLPWLAPSEHWHTELTPGLLIVSWRPPNVLRRCRWVTVSKDLVASSYVGSMPHILHKRIDNLEQLRAMFQDLLDHCQPTC